VNAVWAFDLDGTLIGSVRNDRLRPGARELLTRLDSLGVTCVLWSAGGADYAARKAEQHGIASNFTAFYGKESRGVDGRYTTGHFAPDHQPAVLVDDAPDDVPSELRVVSVAQFIGGNDADRALFAVCEQLA
jgi:phosphoserine phosphatase